MVLMAGTRKGCHIYCATGCCFLSKYYRGQILLHSHEILAVQQSISQTYNYFPKWEMHYWVSKDTHFDVELLAA